MQDDEVAHLVVFVDQQAVVFLRLARIERAVGKYRRELRHAALDHVNAGGLERLQESAGETDRNAVLVPEFPSAPGGESQESRLRARLAVQMGEQGAGRLVIADVGT